MLAELQHHAPPDDTSSAAEWADLGRAVDEAEVAAVLCSQEAAEADQHAGFTEHVDATAHACQVVCAKVALAVGICEGMEDWEDPELHWTSIAATDSILACRVAGASMPLEGDYTQELEPGSICTVLTVERLLLWREQRDGEMLTRRLAMGVMTELVPAGSAANGYEMNYCDGTRGRRKRVPTMLTPAQGNGRSYKYAVWLDQIECTMACGLQQQGGRDTVFYIPVNKSSRRG
jgi:hypothetical protein